MTIKRNRHLLIGCASLALAACGGGSGGSGAGTSFIPAPPPTPVTTPTSASNPLSAPPAGVTSTTDLASNGAIGEVRWNAALQAYEVEVPGYPDARVVSTSRGPYGEVGDLVAADGSTLPLVMLAWTGFQYTRLGHFASSNGSPSGGAFAFGVPTPAGAVPISGTATYSAQIDGVAYTSDGAAAWGLHGGATFNFNFAAGTLSGYIDPQLNGPMEVPALPRYTFTNTVFSAGSTTFSGGFDVVGPTPSYFQGQFTGPAAQELMAEFRAPYFDSFSNSWGELIGAMAGNR